MKRSFRISGIILAMIAFLSVLPLHAFAANSSDITWKQWGGSTNCSSSGLGGFSSPYAVTVDSHGNIYVADSGNNRIEKLTVSTGVWSFWGGSGTALGKFNSPRGVAVDKNGNIYVADTNNNRIQKLDIVTGVWSAWGKIGFASGTGLGEFNCPYGVAVDSEGNIYVADTVNSRIQKRTAGTGAWSSWESNIPGSKALGDFSGPLSVAVDKDDNLYVADTSNNRIQKLDKNTGSWSAWGSYGKNPGEFYFPRSVAVDTDGNIYVADGYNYRVQKLNLALNTWSTWGKSNCTLGNAPGEFSDPKGIAVDENGNIYVSDTGNNRIQKLPAGASSWSAWGIVTAVAAGSASGEFNQPKCVAVDGEGNIYVADTLNNRIQKLNISTGDWSSGGKSDCTEGTVLGEFSHPTGIAVDRDGNIYVADSGNNRIQIYTAATELWSASGTSGTELGQFRGPYGIALDSAGNIYVSDCGNNRVQMRNPSGVWSAFGKDNCAQGSEPGEFNEPYGISIDLYDNLYVADTGNGRVEMRSSKDGQWTAWGTTGSGLGEFSYPAGATADVEGNLYVADTGNGRIQKWTKSTGTWISSGNQGRTVGKFLYPAYVALDGEGNLYVADTTNNRIQYSVKKLPRVAPIAPVASSITINSVILTSNDGTMITFNGQTKPSGSMWTGLTYSHTYSGAYAYIPESDDYLESPGSGTCTFTTLDAYTLSYTAGEHGHISGTATQIVASGGNGTAVTAVPDKGYEFAGWSDGITDATRTDSNVAQDLSVTANFKGIPCTVYYDIYENGTEFTQEVDIGDAATEPDEDVFEGINFPFLGWYDSYTEMEYVFSTPVEYDTYLYAVFDDFYVGFDGNNGGAYYFTKYVGNGDTVAVPEEEPIKEGYTFAGWYTYHYDGGNMVYDEPFDFDTPITERLITTRFPFRNMRTPPFSGPAVQALSTAMTTAI